MSDLVSRVLAAITETEQLALTASPGPWRADGDQYEVLAVDGEVVCEGFALSNNQLRATVNHITRNDPAAVLRRCAADKAILNMYALLRGQMSASYNPGDGARLGDLRYVVEHLARAYGISVEEETTGE